MDDLQKMGFDPVQYGVLLQKVKDMDEKMDKMETHIEELLELANKGKGGLWLGMSVISGISVVFGYAISIFKH